MASAALRYLTTNLQNVTVDFGDLFLALTKSGPPAAGLKLSEDCTQCTPSNDIIDAALVQAGKQKHKATELTVGSQRYFILSLEFPLTFHKLTDARTTNYSARKRKG